MKTTTTEKKVTLAPSVVDAIEACKTLKDKHETAQAAVRQARESLEKNQAEIEKAKRELTLTTEALNDYDTPPADIMSLTEKKSLLISTIQALEERNGVINGVLQDMDRKAINISRELYSFNEGVHASLYEAHFKDEINKIMPFLFGSFAIYATANRSGFDPKAPYFKALDHGIVPFINKQLWHFIEEVKEAKGLDSQEVLPPEDVAKDFLTQQGFKELLEKEGFEI
ncbi:MAG: hypothetical protein WCS28_02380 [Thiomicrospira sp.]